MKPFLVADARCLLKQQQTALFCLLCPYFMRSFNLSVLRSVSVKYTLSYFSCEFTRSDLA